jgi:hypothetical protein
VGSYRSFLFQHSFSKNKNGGKTLFCTFKGREISLPTKENSGKTLQSNEKMQSNNKFE